MNNKKAITALLTNKYIVQLFGIKAFLCNTLDCFIDLKFIAVFIWDVAIYIGVPKGIRTPVAAVKGQCPRPLDDGDIQKA